MSKLRLASLHISSLRLLPILLLIIGAFAQGQASAQTLPLEVQAQLRYDYFSTKLSGQPAVSDGHFSTGYNLLFRRPARPFTSLISDLSFNAYEAANQGGQQTTRNWIMNLFSRTPTYTLTGRVSRDYYNSSFVGQTSSTNGSSTNYSIGLLLTQPAYPTVNIQYLRQKSLSYYGPYSSAYETTTRLLGSYYDLDPFRFTYNSSDQRYGNFGGYGGGSTKTQRSAVQLDRALTSSLRLFGELSKQNTSSIFTGGATNTDVNRRLVRLTASPLPAIVTDLEYSNQSYTQGGAFSTNNTRSNLLSFNFRSQVLPGLSADFTQQTQSLDGDGRFSSMHSTEKSRNFSINGVLTNSTVASASYSQIKYRALPLSQTDQDSIQFGTQTNLTARTDLNLNFGQGNVDVLGSSSYFSRFADLSIRDRSASQLSTGVSYRWSQSRTNNADGTAFNQEYNAVDVNALWTPTYYLGLNFSVGYQSSNGTSVSDTLTASSNVRWQLDTQTNLSVNYSTQNNRQFDVFRNGVFGQRSGGLGFRLTRTFLDRSLLDLTYDYRGENFGGLEWQRQLSVMYTVRL